MRIHFVGPHPDTFISGGNSYNRSLIRALEQEGCEVLLTDMPSKGLDGFSLIDSIEFAKLTPHQIPEQCISLLHHLPSLYPGPAFLFAECEKPILDSFTYHIVTSRFMVDFMISKGYSSSRIVCLEPVVKELNVQQSETTPKVNAIMLNNVIPRKGVLDFLLALAEQRLPPVYRITVVGDLEMDMQYASKCTDLVRSDKNLSRTVRFTGTQDNGSVRRLMSRSNLFISASHFETFGMSIQEASVSGVPLIVFSGGNTDRHVSEGINGHVHTTHMGMARQIERFIDHPEEFIELHKSAQKYTHDYARSWSDHAKKICQLLI